MLYCNFCFLNDGQGASFGEAFWQTGGGAGSVVYRRAGACPRASFTWQAADGSGKRRRRAYSTIKTSKIATWRIGRAWQSVYPYLLNGDLDPVFKKKAEQDKSKTFAEVKAYYRKGYATDVDTIGIENGVMEFHRGDQSSACQYKYAGHKILTYVSGKRACVICSNARMPAAWRRNSCSSAITLLARANRRISISLWATRHRRHC